MKAESSIRLQKCMVPLDPMAAAGSGWKCLEKHRLDFNKLGEPTEVWMRPHARQILLKV